MTGLDKIINQILDEANSSAGEKLECAKAEAAAIFEAAAKEAEQLTAEIAKKSQSDQANYKDRMKSSADLKRRTAMLAAKQEIIADVLEKAYRKFSGMDDKTYFDTLQKMLAKFALPEDGVLYVSGADQKKLPADFAEKMAKIAKEKGGSLTISEHARPIDRGFVLAYGGIEENCSFRALFDAKKDELQDQIQAVLFS